MTTLQKIKPFKDTIGISTGGKRSKFAKGRVEQIKQMYRALGVNIVSTKNAKYVVYPDGTTDFGKNNGRPILFSEFDAIVHNTRTPNPVHMTPHNTHHNTHHNTRTPNPVPRTVQDAIDSRIVDSLYDPDFIDESLSVPIVSKRNTEFLKDKYSPHEWVVPVLEWHEAVRTIEKLQKPELEQFIHKIFNNPFNSQSFPTIINILEDLRTEFHMITRYWKELRKNVEAIFSLDDPVKLRSDSCILFGEDTLLSLEDIERLNFIEFHPSTNWIISTLNALRQMYNPEKQHFFHKPEEFKLLKSSDIQEFDFSQSSHFTKEDVTNYFWKIEQLLRLGKKGISCSMLHMNIKAVEWAKDIQLQFMTGGRCESRSTSCSGICFWNGKACKSKPMLFVLEDVVSAYCRIPISHTDLQKNTKGLIMLFEIISNLYNIWYDERVNLNRKPTWKQLSGVIINMFDHIMKDIHDDLSLGPLQDVMWSEIPTLLGVEEHDWNDLFSKNARKREVVIKDLKRVIYSEPYKNMVRDIVSQLK